MAQTQVESPNPEDKLSGEQMGAHRDAAKPLPQWRASVQSMQRPTRRRLLRASGAATAGGVCLIVGGTTPTPVRILALGDSYTAGTGVEPAERWLAGLVDFLRTAGFDLAEPRVVAEGGWTTADLSEGLGAVSPTERFDLVTLCIGANDAFGGASPATFRAAFTGLLDRAIGFAGGDASNVLVLTIPDYTYTPVGRRFSPEANAQRLANYNRAIETAVDDAGARLVDIAPLSAAIATRPDLVAADGLHPSGKQYERWLDRIGPVAVDALRH